MYTSVYMSTFTLHIKHLKYHSRDFDNGPVVKTLCFHYKKKKNNPKHYNFNSLDLYQILFVALGHQEAQLPVYLSQSIPRFFSFT